MPQVINTNILSLNSQRNLNRSQDAMRVSLQRLSSGLRLNSAKDDAAGLAITERFTAQVRGLNQAARNAADGVSLAQTAEGALQEITNNLQRIRELAIQSANATNSQNDRVSLNNEVVALQNEIDRVLNSTTFNGVLVFEGTTLGFQVGADAASATNMIKVVTSTISARGEISSAMNATISTVAGSLSAIDRVDTALDYINAQRAVFGTIQNRFESVIRNTQNVAENITASRSRIQDTDYAQETAELTRTQILQQAGTTVLAQANQLPQNVLSLLG